jgi:hypothetical protein
MSEPILDLRVPVSTYALLGENLNPNLCFARQNKTEPTGTVEARKWA